MGGFRTRIPAGLSRAWQRESEGLSPEERAPRSVQKTAPTLRELHDNVNINPGNVFAWKKYADACLAQDLPDQAQTAWESALRRNPDNVAFSYYKALFHFMRADDQKALETLNPAMMRIADTRRNPEKISKTFEREHTEKAIALFIAVAGTNNKLVGRVYEQTGMQHETYQALCDDAEAMHRDPVRRKNEMAKLGQLSRAGHGFARPVWGLPVNPGPAAP